MKTIFIIISGILFFNACSYERSPVTGWDYNNPRNGGFEKKPYYEQERGSGLVLVEGGFHQVVLSDSKDGKPEELKVKIPSFYMDETEVTNQDWLEYMYWTERTFGQSFPAIVLNAQPDTSC